ncbi:MAG: hypothetical protein JJT82_06995 [Legionellaceae bacterium]|nr:hypothetical protein [Legionellaceae bacterium]
MPIPPPKKSTPMRIEQSFRLSLSEVCCSFGVEQEWVEAIMAEGIIHPDSTARPHFDGNALRRLRISIRLQQDLDINLSGIALVLDLLDEIEQLKQQLPDNG